jgi:XTP/dITP diphosphohydrolase
MHDLLVATHNQGKLREYRALLADLPLSLLSLDDAAITHEVEETGATFYANATLKARAYAELSGLWTWADDSGLEVDVLDGRPGVLSARYGEPGLNDVQRYMRLLAELRPYPQEQWTARFRCAVAIALPDGRMLTAEDTVEGVITDRPRGEHGFGYDPIFYLPEYGVTLAELPPAVKNRISHRAKASEEGKRLLAALIDDLGF